MSESIGNGLEEQIEDFKKEHSDLKVVFIDTLQMVRNESDLSILISAVQLRSW